MKCSTEHCHCVMIPLLQGPINACLGDLKSQILNIKYIDSLQNSKLFPPLLSEETGCPSEEDVGYMLQFVYKDVENVLKLASNTGHPCQVQPLELFFRGTYTWCKMPLLVCMYALHSCSTWNRINLSAFAC